MTYTIPITLDLGPAHTGKTVYAQLKNESWTNVGSAITTGITEIGTSGKYRTVLTIPDAHSGFVSFYFSTADANTPCCPVGAISPEDKETITAIYAEQAKAATVALDATVAKDSTVAKTTATTAILNMVAGLPTKAEVNAECDSALADAGVTSALMTNLLNLFKTFGYPTDLNMATGILTVFDTDGETPLFTMTVESTGEGPTLHQIKGLLTPA